MSIVEYLKKMKDIETDLLIFMEEGDDNSEINFQNLKKNFERNKIHEDRHTLMSFLHLLTIIANYHHRGPNFFLKIDQILQIFLDDIKKYYKNSEIFNIFENNKRILLFLIENKIITIDKYIAKKIVTSEKYINMNYPQYFSKEIMPFVNEKWFPKNIKSQDIFSFHYTSENGENCVDQINNENFLDNYIENRKIGENDSLICQFIRNDSVIEFIKYITKNNISLNSIIQPSIYETNSFLFDQFDHINLTLIEYAAFFGSIQIFQYLQINGVELDQSLWSCAIHGRNPEIIHLIEELNIKPADKTFNKCYVDSIKCHHYDITNYIQNNLLQNDDENKKDSLIHILKYYNFILLQKENIIDFSFIDFCHYGYYLIADNLLENENIDINIDNWGNKYIPYCIIQNQNIELYSISKYSIILYIII